MSEGYRTEMEVRWADLDANGHVRNTAYSEFATHARLRYLDARGFGGQRFARMGVGPIFFREETVFRRELHLGETVTVEVLCDGLSPDVSRWRIAHRVLQTGGQEAARVTVEGAWLDRGTRKLAAPPAELAEALRALPRTSAYEELRTVLR